jgi:hypothetical protein
MGAYRFHPAEISDANISQWRIPKLDTDNREIRVIRQRAIRKVLLLPFFASVR